MSGPVQWQPLADMPFALGGPPLAGALRASPADFRVDEVLGFEPDGKGEHVLLQIEKTDLNTETVARSLGRLAGVKPVDIGYCGLKDRHAVTTQWFSVALAGAPEPDWAELRSDQLQPLAVFRHGRKLRRGAAQGNRFRIRVRDVDGDTGLADERLGALRHRGVPNYFGEQRFGRDYGNLADAQRLFAGQLKRVKPHLRGLYLSAARSQIFNEVLGLRVERGDWNRALPGDLMQLAGSRSWFRAEAADPDLSRRLDAGDIHPTGPLWGRGALPSGEQVHALESAVVERFAPWCQGLERFGLKQERRALRLPVVGLDWHWESDDLILEFALPSGCFATSVLRELVR